MRCRQCQKKMKVLNVMSAEDVTLRFLICPDCKWQASTKETFDTTLTSPTTERQNVAATHVNDQYRDYCTFMRQSKLPPMDRKVWDDVEKRRAQYQRLVDSYKLSVPESFAEHIGYPIRRAAPAPAPAPQYREYTDAEFDMILFKDYQSNGGQINNVQAWIEAGKPHRDPYPA